MHIADYGWDTYCRAMPDSNQEQRATAGTIPGRVIADSSQLYRVYTEKGEGPAVLTGSLLNTLAGRADYPAVGDWLLVDTEAGHQHWIIRSILPRYSSLVRKVAGRLTEAQVLAANIDYVFIVNGLDGGRNFNPRGIERYLAVAWDSGAQPVVVLNKADLCDDVPASVIEAEAVAPGVPVIAVSAYTGEGLENVEAYASAGSTVVLTGRSGVGKSSIINRLAGKEVMETGEQRTQDLRGKHTTTHRELVRLSSGSLLIDTPGLRELAIWSDSDGINSAFPDIEEFAAECRFSDCTHTAEPGCAVKRAVTEGTLEQSRYDNFLAMRKELDYLRSRRDEKSRKEYDATLKARGKELSRYIRDIKKYGKRP